MKVQVRRSAFTLIELLVVIAIIAILIGLLIPAVQKVRDSAARSSCSNNLKQLATAVHAYHDSNGTFPTSGGTQGGWGAGVNDWSWMAKILPYIEQANLYNSCGVPTAALNSTGFIATPVKTFLCPADLAINGLPSTNRSDLGGYSVGMTCYKGCAGDNWEWGNAAWNPVNCPTCNGNAMNGYNGLDAGNGIFYRSDGFPTPGSHGALTLAVITNADGTSNTFMIGEDIPEINNWSAWPYCNGVTATCAITLNNATQPGQPGYNQAGSDWGDFYSFRSNHNNFGGANFAYADAHVSFISNNIPIATYRALATYNGGENVTPQ